MIPPIRNIVATINALVPTTGNLHYDASVPAGSFDFESVALHEVLHSLGLDHPNAGSESGLERAQQNYTRAMRGLNGRFDLDAGTDRVIGSSDDERDDDGNLHWFRRSNNNPFTIANVVDSTTYARDTGSLPAGHGFAANGGRAVGRLLGVADTEAVMQQGAMTGEAQRELTHDDVAMLRYAMSGLDERADTGDDYTLELEYAGLTASADIVLAFDYSVPFVAGSEVVATSNVKTVLPLRPSPTHYSIHSVAKVFFNGQKSWFFNGFP